MAFYATSKPDNTPEPLTTRYVPVPTDDGDAILMDRQTDTPVKTVSGRIYIAPLENVQWTADSMNLTASIAPEAAPVAPAEEIVPEVGAEVVDPATGEVGTVVKVGPEWFVARFGEPGAPLVMFQPFLNRLFREGQLSPNDPAQYEPLHAAPKPNPAALLHVATLPEPVEESHPMSPMTSAVLRIKTEPENLADWERELLGLPQAKSEPVPALDTYDFETGTPDGLNATQERVRSQEWRDTMADTWRLGAYRSGAKMAEKRLRKAMELAARLDGVSYSLKSEIEGALNALESGRETAEDENPYV